MYDANAEEEIWIFFETRYYAFLFFQMYGSTYEFTCTTVIKLEMDFHFVGLKTAHSNDFILNTSKASKLVAKLYVGQSHGYPSSGQWSPADKD